MKKRHRTIPVHSNVAEKRDSLFSYPQETIEEFEFDDKVAAVFDDMVSRSVPQYDEVQILTANIAARFFQPGTCVYDLGCSTGTTLLLLCRALSDHQVLIYGVDNSSPMLAECRRKLRGAGYQEKVLLMESDLNKVMPGNASVIILNYTLQFISPDGRLDLLRRFYSSLVPGGCLVISEKVVHRHQEMQSCLNDLHLHFKRQQGYSELEIAQKREALEDVLIPLSADENTALLHQAGFEEVEVVLRYLNFCTYLALKAD